MRYAAPSAPVTPRYRRLVAAVVTVGLILLLGSSQSDEAAPPTYDRFVALGDSYTAAPFVPLTDVASGCFRSNRNYPQLVAEHLRIPDLEDRSCSGAQTRHLRGRQRTVLGRRVPPQLQALTKDTDLVTVGIGANDGRLYARIATVCRRSTKGCPLYDQRVQLRAIVDRLGATLASELADIRRLAPQARILLIGYPKLFPPRGTCSRLPRMRSQDRAAFREINLRLREQMRTAAELSEVEFVDFYAASFGHHICARYPWVQGRVGSSRRGAALHPLPAGQAALARMIERRLQQPRPTTVTP